MSLRIRLFLIFSALVAVLVGAHLFLVRSLAADLDAEVDLVALDVGAAVTRALAELGPPCAGADCGGPVEVRHFGPQEAAGGTTWVNHEVRIDQKGGPERIERHVVRRIVRRIGPAPSPAPATGYAYVFAHGTEEGDAAKLETFVIKLGDEARGEAKGALQLRGPGLAAEVPIPRFGLEEKLARFERKVLFGSLLLLAAGLLAAALLAHRVSEPLLRLSRAAVAVGDGQLGLTVDEKAGATELRSALGAFNRMSAKLRELAGQNRRLQQERHLGEIGEIARGLAHSLRNPLHALGLSLEELAQRGRDDEEGAHLLAAAKRQIGRLDRSIRSFLVFASRTGVEPQPVDLGALAADVALEALQDQQARVRIAVETESHPDGDWIPASAGMTIGQLDSDQHGWIAGASTEGAGRKTSAVEQDRPPQPGAGGGETPSIYRFSPLSPSAGRGGQGGEGPFLEIPAVEQELRAMVQALVVNAVEASPPGGQVVVRVGRDPDGERWWLAVDDEGPGVAAEVRARLFTPHVTTKPSGSGMGLFLAQRLAASRYDGRLELSPLPGGGTRARFELGPRVAFPEAP